MDKRELSMYKLRDIITDLLNETAIKTIARTRKTSKNTIKRYRSTLHEILESQPEIKQDIGAVIDQFGLRLVALTCGPEGALMVTPDESSFAAPPVTDVINTVGAGDSFTAAMIMGFLNNEPLDQINMEANRLAAFVCTQHGAVPALPESLKA